MLLEAAVFSAEAMLARGFLNAVLPEQEMAASVQMRALRITQLAPQAARLNKQTLRRLATETMPDELIDGAYRYADSAEHREGISAFLAKRRAGF
jgi:enoyl-CoA hydratase/carnithine racemase